MTESRDIVPWEDIQFAAEFRSVNTAVVDVRVVQIQGCGNSPLQFVKYGPKGSGPPTESFDDADTFLHGHIKWDGCSNWSFQYDCMLHFCGVEQGFAIGILFMRLYDEAAARLEWWDGENPPSTDILPRDQWRS